MRNAHSYMLIVRAAYAKGNGWLVGRSTSWGVALMGPPMYPDFTGRISAWLFACTGP